MALENPGVGLPADRGRAARSRLPSRGVHGAAGAVGHDGGRRGGAVEDEGDRDPAGVHRGDGRDGRAVLGQDRHADPEQAPPGRPASRGPRGRWNHGQGLRPACRLRGGYRRWHGCSRTSAARCLRCSSRFCRLLPGLDGIRRPGPGSPGWAGSGLHGQPVRGQEAARAGGAPRLAAALLRRRGEVAVPSRPGEPGPGARRPRSWCPAAPVLVPGWPGLPGARLSVRVGLRGAFRLSTGG
jgi:hypothetical protein